MKQYENYKDSGIEYIGKIPEHWEVKRIKYKISYTKGRNPKELKTIWGDNYEIYLAMDYLRENPKQIYYVENPENYILVNDNDILLLWDGSNAGEFIKSKKGVLSSTMAILKIENIQRNYSFYFLKMFEKTLKESTTGMGIPHVNSDEFKNARISIPLVEEQVAIANFLDKKTAKIDKIIENKQKLVALYEEEKQAIINQAVTKGLDPNVKMKDSGVEWLGKIPEHWILKKIGYCSSIVRGGSPRPSGDQRYFCGDYIHWITVKEVTNAVGKYIESTQEFLTEEGSKLSRIIYPETLLLSNSGATLGVPKISKIKGCINDGSVAFTSFKDCLLRDYLFYFFESHTQIYREEMKGNGQPNLNTEIIMSTPIAIPPIEEQQKILLFIEKELSRLDTIIEKFNKQIELLQEYRTTLISEVVTGKVKVN